MKRLLFLLLLTVYNLTAQDVFYQRVMPAPPSPQNVTDWECSRSGDIIYADIDGDGDQDVLISNSSVFNGKFYLYTNDGNGNFTKKTNTSFPILKYNIAAFGDIDGDGDPDLMLAGRVYSAGSYDTYTLLYTNDGFGNFTEVSNTPFTGVADGTINFVDTDNDGDLDIFITGVSNSAYEALLYVNDGTGNYTEINMSYWGLHNTAVDFADIDGDNDLDMLMTGETLSNGINNYAILLKNNGNNNFTEITNTPFPNISNGSVDFADINGDGDMDLLITGNTEYDGVKTILYTNDGTGFFSEVSLTPFVNVGAGSADFADIDNDGDLDVVIAGKMQNDIDTTNLYINDGTGIFIESNLSYFPGTRYGSVVFADVNYDGYPDLSLIGNNDSFYENYANLYMNNTDGTFTEATGNPFLGISAENFAFADIDGDNDQDILITGNYYSNQGYVNLSKLYTNDGTGIFTEQTGTNFTGLRKATVRFADIDGDNDQDVFIMGTVTDDVYESKLYTNDGSGNFTEVTGTPFPGVGYGDAVFADFNGDGAPDLLIMGVTSPNSSYQNANTLYINDGAGNFTELTGNPFIYVRYPVIAFADIDNDNDLDVVISGIRYVSGNEDYSVRLYTNDGNANFNLTGSTVFGNAVKGDISFGDIDGDNDQDVIITGAYNYSNSGSTPPIYTTKLYKNNGTGNFTQVNYTPFPGVDSSSTDFADIDGDGDLDLLLSGHYENTNGTEFNISKIYLNDGTGNFSETTNIRLPGIENAVAQFVDIDANNTPDIMLAGESLCHKNITALFKQTSPVNLSSIDQIYNTPVGTYIEYGGELFVTAQQVYPTGEKVIFAQNAQGGIKIHLPDGINPPLVNPYDGITGLKGQLVNESGMLQLNLSQAYSLTGNNQVQQPQVITISDYLNNPSEYEAELIKLNNISIDAGTDDVFSNQQSYVISDTSGEMALRVFFQALSGESIPAQAHITGIAGKNVFSAQIFPRDNNDIETIVGIDTDDINHLKVYPNPVNHSYVRISSGTNTSKLIQLYDLTGKLIFSRQIKNNTGIDLQQIQTGIYLMKITENDRTDIIKLIIR